MVYLADAVNTAIIGKGLMIAFGFIGPSIGIGLFVAIVELFGLLAFASTFIVK